MGNVLEGIYLGRWKDREQLDVDLEDRMLSLQVHQMAIASERKCLPILTARSWQQEELEAVKGRRSSELDGRVRMMVANALDRIGQLRQGLSATTPLATVRSS